MSKVSEQTAKNQLEEFLAHYEIEEDDFDSLVDDKGNPAVDFSRLKKKLTKAFRAGRLEWGQHEGKMRLLQHLKEPPKNLTGPLVWGGVSGMAKAVGLSAGGTDIAVTFAAAVVKEPKDALLNLVDKDYSTMETVASVFLLV